MRICVIDGCGRRHGSHAGECSGHIIIGTGKNTSQAPCPCKYRRQP